MADTLKGRRKRGTALDSLRNRELLATGVPFRDPDTGVVEIREVTTSGSGSPLGRAFGRVAKRVQKVTAPKVAAGRVSAEHKLSDTRRGMGVLKKRKY